MNLNLHLSRLIFKCKMSHYLMLIVQYIVLESCNVDQQFAPLLIIFSQYL